MLINIIAVGQKMPAWITQGYNEYAQRMPRDFATRLIEINAEKRSKNSNPAEIRKKEARRIIAALPRQALPVALDVKGQSWSTEKLADRLDNWRQRGSDLALMIGGPDGLDDECKNKAEAMWSLSPLTLPHPLVRLILAEQLYRAWSILQNHPYHRGDA